MDQRQMRTMLNGRLTRRATLRGAGAVGVAAALASQAPRAALTQEATPAVATYPEAVITATEYAFDMPATIDGGWTLVTLDNQGTMPHHAFFLQPTGGATVEEVQAALESPDVGPILEVATAIGGPPSADPGGGRVSVAMNLAPGQYVVVCAIPDDNNVPHYMLGQQAAVEVTARAGNALPAFAETRITMVDHQFDGLPAEVPAGMNTWEVFNDGGQIHEMVIFRLAPGVTFETVQMMLGAEAEASPSPAGIDTASPVASPMASMASPEAGGPPFFSVGGVAALSPGQTVWAVMELEAGDHLAISFVPEAETGAPQYTLGMIAPFTVS